MKLKSIAANQTEITINNNCELTVFFSYETPVAFIANVTNKKTVTGKTNQFYSQTTTKHINAFFQRHGFLSENVDQVPQSDIDNFLK